MDRISVIGRSSRKARSKGRKVEVRDGNVPVPSHMSCARKYGNAIAISETKPLYLF